MTTGLIVVGVDGSRGGDVALRWAIDEARRRGAELEVVYAWHYPPTYGLTPLAAGPIDGEEIEAAARTVGPDAVRRVAGTDHPDGVHIRYAVAEGPAAAALLKAAEHAAMVVVGSRGLGGFAGLLLGSVSHQVAHHARCPVMIVPDTT